MSAGFLKPNHLPTVLLLLAAIGGGVASWRWHVLADGHRAEAAKLRDRVVFLEALSHSQEVELENVRRQLAAHRNLLKSVQLPAGPDASTLAPGAHTARAPGGTNDY